MIQLGMLFGEKKHGFSEVEFKIISIHDEPRWMIESSFFFPWYLKTWGRTSFRTKVISSLIWLLSLFRFCPLKVTRVRFSISDKCLYSELRAKFNRIAIFLGTPGDNRKLVVYAGNSKEELFIKVPTTVKAESLVAQEISALQKLSDSDLTKRLIPKYYLISGYLATENVLKKGVNFRPLSTELLFDTHNRLFERSSVEFSKADIIDILDRYISNLRDMKYQDNKQSKLQELVNSNRLLAKTYLDSFDHLSRFEFYEAHGDFTRWNVALGPNNQVQAIDWEFSGFKPRFFDIIHYQVSYDILVKSLLSQQILDGLDVIGDRYSNEDKWSEYVRLYFTFQSLQYCSLYENQLDIFPQIFKQLETWRDCQIILQKKANFQAIKNTRLIT
jgi:thiamine kinase-like enzyme